jgi:hypothetical protein
MSAAVNYKQVLKHFLSKRGEIPSYFPAFPELVKNFHWDVSVTYVFSRIESGKHIAIYCGIVKLHGTDAKRTKELVDGDHMSRTRFKELFRTVYGQPIPEDLLKKLEDAEKVRDKISHGKRWQARDARGALVDIFDFAEGLNNLVRDLGGFSLFGDLRGFKGARRPLSKKTTELVLRGVGLGTK